MEMICFAMNFDIFHMQLVTACNVKIDISASNFQQAKTKKNKTQSNYERKEFEVRKPERYYHKNIQTLSSEYQHNIIS